MARNKHPEETIEKILDVSLRLFTSKGYDHTTIQDIVDALGMSKGAVYHHFKSKEDIIDQITTKYYEDNLWFKDICTDKSLNGLEKLRKVFYFQLCDKKKLKLDLISINLLQNPKILVASLLTTMETGGTMVRSLVEEGIRDGSIHTDYPKEVSETLLLLINIWVVIFTLDKADFKRKIGFIKDFTDRMGLPILDDALLLACDHYYDQVLNKIQTNTAQ